MESMKTKILLVGQADTDGWSVHVAL